MRRGLWLAIGGTLAVGGCEPTAAECGDAAPAVGVFCFPDEAVVRVGRGFAPTGMVVVDLDGDGALDVAAVNPSRATLSIHWGDGEGRLERMSSWPLGQAAAGVTHGDLDGDGRVDLATALPDSDAVAVLYNRGARGFVLRRHAAGSAPRGLLAVQLDGQGPAALVTANVGDGSVSVLRRGVVGASTIVGGGPQALAAGDLDGDGAPELAVALRDDDAVQVLHTSGEALVPGARHAVGVTPSALVIGDLDGDGRGDLASADQLGDTVSVIFGDGRGAAREAVRWPVESQPTGLVIVRGGGVLPVLGVLSEGTSTAARLDPRSGALAGAATLARAGAIAAADLDHDGREELLHGAREGGVLGALRPGLGLRVTPRWSALALNLGCALDLEGDGVDELIGWRTDGDFTLIAEAGGRDFASGLASIRGCRGVDLAGTGREELLLWGEVASDSDGLTLLRRVGEGWVSQFMVPFPGLRLGPPVLGDAYGDGSLELVVPSAEHGVGDRPGALWLLGELAAEAGPVMTVLDPRWVRDLVVVDMDGDAALDVAGVLGEEVLVYRGIGGDEAPRSWWVGDLSGPLVAGDFDGDDREDLLIDGDRALFAVGEPSAAIRSGIGAAVRPIAAIDLDEDGDLDVLAEDLVGSRALTLLRNDGAGGFTAGGRVPAGDGRTLLAPVRLGGGVVGGAARVGEAVQVFELGAGEVLIEGPGPGLAAERPGELADLDGDGRVDFVALGEALAFGFGAAGGLGPTHHVPRAALLGDEVSSLDVAAGDLDGDGAAELVLVGVSAGASDFALSSLTIVRVAGNGGAAAEGLGSFVGAFSRVFVRDLDGDANNDVLLAGPGPVISYLRGRGDGSFAPALTQMGSGSESAYPLWLQRVDDDDRLDMLWYQAPRLLIARGQGGGNFDAPRPWWGGNVNSAPLVADVTGDGRVDLVLGGPGVLTLFAGNGHGVGAARTLTPLESAVLAQAAGDLDGDGVRELLVASTNFAGDLTLRQGTRAGAGFVFTVRGMARRLPFGEALELRVEDLDGDTAPDVALLDAEGMTIVRQRP